MLVFGDEITSSGSHHGTSVSDSPVSAPKVAVRSSSYGDISTAGRNLSSSSLDEEHSSEPEENMETTACFSTLGTRGAGLGHIFKP